MSAVCDAHKKKVGVELLYNSVHRKFNQLDIRYGRENQHPENLGLMATGLSSTREQERNAIMARRVGGQYVADLFGLQLPLTHKPFNKVRGIFF